MISMNLGVAVKQFLARLVPWQCDAIRRIRLQYFVGSPIESVFESDTVLELQGVREIIVTVYVFPFEPEAGMEKICAGDRDHIEETMASAKEVEFRFQRAGPAWIT